VRLVSPVTAHKRCNEVDRGRRLADLAGDFDHERTFPINS